MVHDLKCPNCGNTEHIAGYEVRGVYDGVLFWICTVCSTAFQRWPEGDRLYQKAEYYILKWNTEEHVD